MNSADYSIGVGAKQFKRYREKIYQLASPLYTRLSLCIEEDPEILKLALPGLSGDSAPHLFFSAVHHLLLAGTQHPLRDFFPDLNADYDGAPVPYPLFRAFCLDHAEALSRLLDTRWVQTNEVQRSACLLPAFEVIARQCQGRPLSLVEVGASAGLNLLWDHYGYNYGAAQYCGDEASPVQLACATRGITAPPIPRQMPGVTFRIGIDLNPISVLDAEAILWLRALILPEQHRRTKLLAGAIQVALRERPRLVAGDAFEVLPDVLALAPADSPVCIFHTIAVNHGGPAGYHRLASLIADQAAGRDLFHLSIEWFGGGAPTLDLVSFRGGTRKAMRLAACASHGEWIEWTHTTGRLSI